jgi:hypothetical protein
VRNWKGWAVGIVVAVLIFRDPVSSGHAVSQAWAALWTFIGSA